MKKIFLYLAVVSLLVSCKKESDTFEGPSIEETFGEFEVLEDFAVSDDEVDFAAGEICYFTAEFTKTVDWTITIDGLNTGSQKILTGSSKVLDETNAVWNGSTSKFPVFAAEPCKAVLVIEDVADTFMLDLTTLSPKTNEGLVLADFEVPGFDPDWTVFIQTGADMDFQAKQDNLAPHGVGYLNMAGEVNWDWLIGLVDFNASAYTTTENVLPLSSDPDNLYFNCMIYGEPETNPSIVLFQFKEDENEDGSFDSNNEDQYDYEIKVDWEGWKLVSLKYADLTTLVNGQPAEPNGNGIKNPNQIGKVSMLHLANLSGGFASTKIDYLIFTTKPLEP